MSDTKELVFWAGNPQLYLDKQLIELSRDDNRLLDFVEMFTDPDDRYLAYSLFEEKPLLEIALMDERFFEDYEVSLQEIFDGYFEMKSHGIFKKES